jgi:anti-anti-sigma factor
MTGLWFTNTVAGPYGVITVGGEVDAHSAGGLREHLLIALCHLSPRLVLDLTHLTFIDSSGLAALVVTWKLAEAGGGTLRLAGASAQVARKLHTTGLDQRLPIHPDVETAIKQHPAACPEEHKT